MPRLSPASRVTVIAAGLLAFTSGLAGSAAAGLWSRAGSGAGLGRAGGVSAVTVSVPGSTVTNGTVAVSWTAATAPSGATITYVVDRKSGSTYTSVCGTGTTPTAATSCSDTSVPNGTYQYRVTAMVGANWATASLDSGTVTVTASSPPTVTIDKPTANQNFSNGGAMNNNCPSSVTGVCGTATAGSGTLNVGDVKLVLSRLNGSTTEYWSGSAWGTTLVSLTTTGSTGTAWSYAITYAQLRASVSGAITYTASASVTTGAGTGSSGNRTFTTT